MPEVVGHCRGCKVPCMSDATWRRSSPEARQGMSHMHARGCCAACYKRLVRYGDPQGSPWPAPRKPVVRLHGQRSVEEVLEDWVVIRDYDTTDLTLAAARIGMSRRGLYQALWRARRRGDPRGSMVPYAHDMRRAA